MGVEGAKDISQVNMLMNLRKACNHPFLFGEPRTESGEFIGESDPSLLRAASGKFQLLGRMLPRLKAEGHKVLIFSQMTKLLDILQDYLDTLGYDYCRIDGQVKVLDRQSSIERFNSDPDMFVFLLSTRAGGLGINLQSADTCIIFDSDWNPHQDSQAQDRCHRIGQDRPVVVYRLLTADSVEIEVMEKQISKKKLDRLTISAGNFSRAGERAGGNLTLRRLKELLEDDVKNLARMTGASVASMRAERPHEGISDTELNLILDRGKLFPNLIRDESIMDGEEGPQVMCGIPLEGDMYDVVVVSDEGGMLHSIC
jgi:ATP-dependent DNA helicase